MDLEEGAKDTMSLKMKTEKKEGGISPSVSLHIYSPEQYDVSRRAPAGWNEGPHYGQSHVDFEDAVTVALPGALAQAGGHVHAGRHHLADAGAVMKHLMNQMWQGRYQSVTSHERST